LRLGALAAGPAAPEQWGLQARHADFFDLKADVEALLSPRVGRYERVDHPALHPGRAAAVWLDDRQIGVVGELHPQWVQKYGLVAAPVVLELQLDALLETTLPSYREISKFPAVVRDLALVVSETVSAESLAACLRAAAPALVKDIRLFDLYTGTGVEQEQKSLAFRVVMQDTQKTLADAEVDAVLADLVQAAAQKYAAKLRG
jgi:phenylalanyl-tRNA synthetase beta chain